MELIILSLILGHFFNFILAFNIGDFVVITDLTNKPKYNGSIALVQRANVTEGRHMILSVDNECMSKFAFGGRFDAQFDCTKSVIVRDEYLEPLEWNVPDEMSFEHVFLNFFLYGRISTYVDRIIPDEEAQLLDRLVLMIRLLCQDEASELYKYKITEKLRVIGAWINQRLDYNAMVYVCDGCEPLKNHIAYIWHGIGVWSR